MESVSEDEKRNWGASVTFEGSRMTPGFQLQDPLCCGNHCTKEREETSEGVEEVIAFSQGCLQVPWGDWCPALCIAPFQLWWGLSS